MPTKIKIPKYAKYAARKGLEERSRNKAGLTKEQAERYKIQSGVERAKQIINSRTLEEKDLKSIARFYLRFRNCRTGRCETALKLWGGRRFGQLLAKS
jgi:hypothetical protein